jgi:hypothetical protein
MSDITKQDANLPKSLDKKLQDFIKLKKQVDEIEVELKSELFAVMKNYDVISIKNDGYTVTLAKRHNYSVIREIPSAFSKTVLDTAKVGKHVKLYGETPVGVEQNTTEYIIWRAK